MSKLKILVTGACGFIGYCLTKRLIDEGYEVVGVDNLSRAGTAFNKDLLIGQPRFNHYHVDVANIEALEKIFVDHGPFGAVFHLAAQVAVTLSYIDRVSDFENNARASFNVVECAKRHSPESFCLYASTNKVYGHISTAKPIGLEMPLDPYTPYGVSKAVGEMYFTEYGRPEIGLTTCSFRQSCIYGHHQFGVEDQGWVAWFAIANLLDRGISIYGDGKQVRDLLFVEDLVDLYLQAFNHRLVGVYPVGGGVNNAISVVEGLDLIQQKSGKPYPSMEFSQARPGDQPYFIADLSWVNQTNLCWSPKFTVQAGLDAMLAWMTDNLPSIREVIGSSAKRTSELRLRTLRHVGHSAGGSWF